MPHLKDILASTNDHAKKTRDFLLDLIFPIECVACGHEGTWLCRRCFSRLKLKTGQYCLDCKQPNRFGEFCAVCAPARSLSGVWIAGDYEDRVIAKMIKGLKYHFARELADILGSYLSLFFKDLLTRSRLSGIHLRSDLNRENFTRIKSAPGVLFDLSRSMIVPVPLHKKRERWRGFNQSLFLAEKLAKNFNIKINATGLVRTRHSRPQAKLSGTERLSNIRDCFTWSAPALSGQNIIIVDDVVTTGSTLDECARVLKKAGAGEVWALVVAKG